MTENSITKFLTLHV